MKVLLERAQTADLLADILQFPTELLIITELIDFLLGLTHRHRSGQRLGDSFVAPLVGEAQTGAMTAVVGLCTAASRFPTTPHGTNDGIGAHVLEVSHRAEQFGAAGFQGREGVGTGTGLLSFSIRYHNANLLL